MIPKASAQLHHPDLLARNVFVRGVGHLSLPIDGRVVHEIGTTLAHLDVDGHTLTSATVTTIGPDVLARAASRTPRHPRGEAAAR